MGEFLAYLAYIYMSVFWGVILMIGLAFLLRITSTVGMVILLIISIYLAGRFIKKLFS